MRLFKVKSALNNNIFSKPVLQAFLLSFEDFNQHSSPTLMIKQANS
jgi:hypothetical protein